MSKFAEFIMRNLKPQKDLQTKLKKLYSCQDTIPPLIEGEEKIAGKKVTEQSLSEYYVKLQMVVGKSEGEGTVDTYDKVIGEKRAIEVANIFSKIDHQHPAVGKILLLGAAGVGKTTLLHYMSYYWGKGRWDKNDHKVFDDKFEYLFRLKTLLNKEWSNSYPPEAKDNNLLACLIHRCLTLQISDLESTKKINKGEIKITLEQVVNSLRAKDNNSKILLLLDGYDEMSPLENNYERRKEYGDIIDSIFEYQNVLMTSRPNAINDEMRAKFERQVANEGLDTLGVRQYVKLSFRKDDQQIKLGEALENFLLSNNNVLDMCKIPINTALLCLIWRDQQVRDKLTSKIEGDQCNIGLLYKGLVGENNVVTGRYIEIVNDLINKFNSEEQEKIITRLQDIICKETAVEEIQDWQLTKQAIDGITKIATQVKLPEENVEMLVDLLMPRIIDANYTQAAMQSIVELLNSIKDQTLLKKIVIDQISKFEDSDWQIKKLMQDGIIKLLNSLEDKTVTSSLVDKIIPLLTDKDENVRKAAIKVIATLVNSLEDKTLTRSFIDKIIPLLADQGEDVRKVAIKVIATLVNSLEDKTVTSSLIDKISPLLSDKYYAVREAAINGIATLLNSLEDKKLIKMVINQVNKLLTNTDLRAGAVKVIVKTATNLLLPKEEFIRYLNHPSKEIRDQIVNNLGKSFKDFLKKIQLLEEFAKGKQELQFEIIKEEKNLTVLKDTILSRLNKIGNVKSHELIEM